METLELIRQIIAENIAANIRPTHAIEIEVIKRQPEAANDLPVLERMGMIKMGETINSRWIVIVDASTPLSNHDKLSNRLKI
jgi:hypothetical protein